MATTQWSASSGTATGIDDDSLDLGGTEARVTVEPLEEGEPGGQAHIGADQVGQLERAQAEADAAHGIVDGGDARQPALVDAEGL